MSQCLPLNGASVLQPSVYKAAILPWTMTHTGKSRRIRHELCSSWGVLKMRIQSHKFLEKLSVGFPLTALIFKICCYWYTSTKSRLAANCQWASRIHHLPLTALLTVTNFSSLHFPARILLMTLHLPYSSEPPQIIFSSSFYISRLLYFSASREKVGSLFLTPCKLHLDLQLPKSLWRL